MSNIIDRFKVQTLSAQIHYEQKGLTERQCHCLRTKNSSSFFIDLYKSPDAKKAYYKGLQTCGSVFSCPVCAVKITEHRKKEIEQIIEQTADYNHYLVTLTIPHYRNQSCKNVRKKFMLARRKFKKWGYLKRDKNFKPYTATLKKFGLVGSVTTVEVTYGQNGWHVHSHELLIIKKSIDLADFRALILENWVKACNHAKIKIKDISSFNRRSVVVDELKNNHINKMSTYLTKVAKSENWGVSAELSKGIIKKADNNNLTPFGMLHLIHDTKDKALKTKYYNKYSKRFWEYCQAFKGSHFINFSKGLKAKYNIDDLSDDEIVNAKNIMEDFYGYFEASEWRDIKKYRLRGFVIDNSTDDFKDLQLRLNNEIIIKKGLSNAKQRLLKAS